MIDVPRIGTAIVLMDASRYTYASRVEGGEGSQLTVARPSGLPSSSPYDGGAVFEMSWTGKDGVTVAPVTLVRSRREKHLALWDIQITGDTWVEQRREFVRVPVFGRISLEPIGPDGSDGAFPLVSGSWSGDGDLLAAGDEDMTIRPPEPVQGVLIDLSEAAVQCTIWADADDDRLEVGTLVRCRFTLHDEEIESVGTILKQRPGDEPHQTTVVVEFLQSESRADTLRRHVYAIQIDMRQSVKAQEAAEAAQRAARAALDEADAAERAGAPAARIRATKWSAAKAASRTALPPDITPEKAAARQEPPAAEPADADQAPIASPPAPGGSRGDSSYLPQPATGQPGVALPSPDEMSEVERLFMVGKTDERPEGTEEFRRDL